MTIPRHGEFSIDEQAKAGNAIYEAIAHYWEVYTELDESTIKSDVLEMLGQVEAEREGRS